VTASAFRRAAFSLMLAGVAAYAALVAAGSGAANLTRLCIELAAVGMLAWGAAVAGEARPGWSLVTASTALWAVGDMTATTATNPFFLSSYCVGYVGLLLLMRAHSIRPWRAWLVLDGLIVGLTMGAIFAAALHALARPGARGVPLFILCFDTLILVSVSLAIALRGWRPGRGWWLLAACSVLEVTTAAVVLATGPADIVHPGWLAQGLYLFVFVSFPIAAWQSRGRAPRPAGWAVAAIPLGLSIVAIGLLVHAGLVGDGAPAVLFAGAALLFGVARALLLLRRNAELLAHAREAATTDKLTGLPNRRALLADLERASDHTLVFFDLDGFKDYNDAFGHHAGDALLQRQAPRLAAVGPAYRLGGDEFCVLLEGRRDEGDALVLAAVEALSERGDGFEIGASFGLVVPGRDPAEALRLADERMYARKRRRRAGQRGPARDVLVQAMAERDLDAHSRHVARLAAAAGRRLGLDAEELDVLVRAAELHDVGKLAIPAAILDKPGPLDDAEWALMRQHTIAGERILAVAESMRPVARIVRASHERWDGGGYPDGLGGEAIPLGARIVCACDALEAMLSRRAYKEPIALEDALAELRRCAGTQFDPRVVEVVVAIAATNLDTVVSG
jgi:two-component system, cell cycle response regulator